MEKAREVQKRQYKSENKLKQDKLKIQELIKKYSLKLEVQDSIGHTSETFFERLILKGKNDE